MRSQPSILPRLPFLCILPFFWGTTGICAVALLLGRSSPESAADHSSRHSPAPSLLVINYCKSGEFLATPRILDRETERIVPFTLPDASNLELLGFSPWRDGEGQSHVIVRRRGSSGNRSDRADEQPLELARYTFPAGRLLDRVALDLQPFGRVCWLPDRSECILFAGADLTLYLYDFSEANGGRGFAAAAQPRPLRWQGVPPGVGPVQLQDPCWPSVPELAGRLIVSLCLAEDASGPYLGPQLWWLHVDPNEATIVTAGRVIVPDWDGSTLTHEEERLACVGTAPDGTPLLAYLARTRDRAAWDLWVAPITFEGPNRTPRVLSSARRKLAEGCVGLVLAFSADGRSIYVSLRDESNCGLTGALRSYRVPEDQVVCRCSPGQDDTWGGVMRK
jgi:hypothetical protein